MDLKLVANALNEKKVILPTQREAEQLTGLQAGGISPLALINKGFQVLLDTSAENFPEIHISGGQRGLNIRLPVTALVLLTKAQIVTILIRKSLALSSYFTYNLFNLILPFLVRNTRNFEGVGGVHTPTPSKFRFLSSNSGRAYNLRFVQWISPGRNSD